MKRKLFIILQVLALLFTGAMGASWVEKVMPNLAALGVGLGSEALAGASGLTVEPKAPLAPLTPTSSGFTYQGSLKNGGTPANGQFDFLFSLYDASTGGNLVGNPSVITTTNLTVTGGLFTAQLDFGSSAFDGNARYLEIAVRASGGGAYTTLTPRQPITPAPYALFALKTQPYKNVVTVAQSGGQYTSISVALASITDSSSTNPYLVRVGPGVYTETVIMKQWVDIEGSGEKATRITFAGSNFANAGTVVGANNAELRSLTVENTGGNSVALGIYNSGTSPSLLHVTVMASGATDNSFGVGNFNSASPSMSNVTAIASGGANNNYGVYNYSSSPNMNNVTATASGAHQLNEGVYNYYSSPSMSNVTATASGGPANVGVNNEGTSIRIVSGIVSATGGGANYGVYSFNGSSVTIDNSTITVPLTGTTIYNSSGTTTKLGASRLVGGPVSNTGTLTCSASYDGNNRRLGAQCTPDSKVLYVATTGGDFTSVTGALNSITDNSSTNRYLIRVGPGTFSEQVIMKAYVDIEGSGEKSTKITFTGNVGANSGTVVGATNAELRSISAENTGGGQGNAIAVYNNGASPSLLHVTAVAFGGTATSIGVFNANSSSPTMIDVTATAFDGPSYNYGVLNRISCSPTMIDVSAAASSSGNFSLNIGVSNESSSSPTMTNVMANASGGAYSDNYGVANQNSSPSMINVNATATASGVSTESRGVSNVDNSSPSMSRVTVTASGGSSSLIYGVYNENSSPRISGSIIKTSGLGVTNRYSGTVLIDTTKITSDVNTVDNGSGVTTKVGASQLSGWTASNAGTLSCSASYDGNNKRLGADCTGNTKVAVVGLTDGDYTSIQAALNDVATWCGTPSATNKCLVRVQPGTYSERVTMVQFVDIEGSGELTTKITLTGSAAANTGTVVGASNAELRFLTVENTGGNSYSIAIYNSNNSPSLRNVTAKASGTTGSPILSAGVYNTSSSPTMTSVTASAFGPTENRGVYNNNSSPRIVSSNISGSGGTQNFGLRNDIGGTVTIDGSKVTGVSTISNGSGVTTRVGASQLAGGSVSNSGTLVCAASYDGNYGPLGSNCQ